VDFDRHVLPDLPDSTSPGGGAEIRHILRSPRGDLTHAVCHAGEVAPTHELPELDESYFVLAGEGEIWRRNEEREATTQLRPGRFVWMPAGCQFQYRANRGTSLVFLVVVLPSWRPELFHIVDAGPWTSLDRDTRTPWEELSGDWFSGDKHHAPDSVAPDGSEIRLLGGVEKGSLGHCTLRQGTTSRPVRHRTVHELWYVIGGHGELWRADPAGEERVDLLWPGVGVDIPTGCAFQFRVTGCEPLEMVLLTMPRWPGANEALPVTDGRWSRPD
jgi:mannose-6-phosphate isomerase-like protein (cupin superfamily)